MKGVLKLLTWPDYVDPRTLHQFSQAFQIEIEPVIVPSAVELVARLTADPAAADLLVPPDYAVRELRAAARLLRLEAERLPNARFLEPRFGRGRPHDPAGEYTVIKDWGTTGILYRTDLIAERPRSWADFWNLAAHHPGRVTALDSPGEVIGAALKMRGRSYNAADPPALEAARRDLLELKRHLLAFETNYRPLLSSGEAWAALGWNGDAAALQAGGTPVRYVIPQEGSQVWEDDWAISAGSRRSAAAHTFLNFLLQPEIAAQEARYTRYATANRAGRELLDEAMRQDESTYPSEDVLRKLEAGLPLEGEAAVRRASLWREVRN